MITLELKLLMELNLTAIAHCIFSDVYSLVDVIEFLQVQLEPDHTVCAVVSLAKRMVFNSVQRS